MLMHLPTPPKVPVRLKSADKEVGAVRPRSMYRACRRALLPLRLIVLGISGDWIVGDAGLRGRDQSAALLQLLLAHPAGVGGFEVCEHPITLTYAFQVPRGVRSFIAEMVNASGTTRPPECAHSCTAGKL